MTTSIEKKLNKEIASLFYEQGVKNGTIELNEKITFDDFLKNRMMMSMAIRRGVPFTLFELIKKVAPFNENEWAMFLQISTKSLQRYKAAVNHIFKPYHSERIIEIAEVTMIGLEVFGNIDKLKSWFVTPNFALRKLKPTDLLMDSYGKELVISELSILNYGLLS